MAELEQSQITQSGIIQPEYSNNLIELSETDQEILTGGYNPATGFDFLIFQDTAIDTFGESQTNLSNSGGLSASNVTRTGYSFRQTTLVLAFSRFGGGGNNQNNPLALIFGLFQRFGLGGGQ